MVEKVRELMTGERQGEDQGEENGEGMVPPEDAGERFLKLSALLKIGTSCQALLDVVAEEVMTLGGWASIGVF